MQRQELGQMLLGANMITPEQLEEAVQNQVIFGGRLGTNLIELGYLDEHALSRFLAKQHGVPTVDWNSLANIHQGLFKIFPKRLAQKYEALPVKLEKNKLYVVMSDPGHIGTISEMSFATGKAIKPLVLPEVRIFELLYRFYGIGRELRYINLAISAKVETKETRPRTPVAKISPAPKKEEDKLEPLKVDVKFKTDQDLMSEEEFSQLEKTLYTKKGMDPPLHVEEKVEVQPPALSRPQPRPGPQPYREVAQTVYSVLIKNGADQYLPKSTIQEFIKRYVSDQLKDRVFSLRHLANYLLTEANVQMNWLEMVLTEIQKLEPQLDVLILLPGEQPPAPAEAPVEEELEEVFELEELEAEEIEELEAIEEIEEVEEVEEIEEERPIEELTLAQAQEKLLNEVNDRTDISRIVLGFAMGYFKRSALFTVRGDKAFGWDGLGGVLKQKLVESIMLSLDQDSVFKTVFNTSCHYLGPMMKVAENEGFLEKLGGEHPNNVFLIPIVVNEKVVYMLYGDNGEGQNVPFDIGELLILTQKIPQSINELVRRKKASHAALQGS